MDFNQARFNMVKQQIRPWDVSHPGVIELLSTLPRERFLPEAQKAHAYADTMLPIGHGQFALPPKTLARIAQEIDPGVNDTILEIGTGTGYLTAILASLSKFVFTVEVEPELSNTAQAALNDLKISNVHYDVGQSVEGWSNHQPYDAIVLNGGMTSLSDTLKSQVKPGGKIFAFIGEAPVMQAMVYQHQPEDNSWQVRSVFDTLVPPLTLADNEATFTF